MVLYCIWLNTLGPHSWVHCLGSGAISHVRDLAQHLEPWAWGLLAECVNTHQSLVTTMQLTTPACYNLCINMGSCCNLQQMSDPNLPNTIYLLQHIDKHMYTYISTYITQRVHSVKTCTYLCITTCSPHLACRWLASDPRADQTCQPSPV